MPLTENIYNWWRKLKLLLDQNLSPSLISHLHDLFPESTHVQDVDLDRASDNKVWEFARDKGFAIVTQDSDFADRALLAGFPPKIIWLRAGNCTTNQVEHLIRDNFAKIMELHDNDDAGVLVIR